MKSINANSQSDESLSLKELYLVFTDYLKEIRRCWLVVLGCVLLFMIYFVYAAMSDQRMYTAELTFMVNEDETASSSGGLAGLVGGLGLGSIGQTFNVDKILALVKSRRILSKAILNKAEVNFTNDFLANHLINYLDSIDQWQPRDWYEKFYLDESPLKDFRFVSYPDTLNPKRQEQSALNILSALLGSQFGGLIETSFGEKDMIMSISMTTSEEELSLRMVNQVFETLSAYYIDKTIEKQKYTYDVVKEKADSISIALATAEYNYANFKDRSRGLFQERDNLPKERYLKEIQKLTILYAEVLKNLEIADFSLKNKTPFIQVLDYPNPPLRSSKKSIPDAIPKAIIVGLLVSLGFIVSRKFLKTALA